MRKAQFTKRMHLGAMEATCIEFVEWFPDVDEQQVRAVLEHEAKALRVPAAH